MASHNHIHHTLNSILSMNKDSLNIMLIDDDEAAHILHKIAIEDAGYNTDTVKSFYGVDKAIENLKSIIQSEKKDNWPQYIFLDINMPMKTGYDFIEEYALLDKKYINPKIFLVSSSENPSDKKKAEDIELIYSFKSKFLDREFISNL